MSDTKVKISQLPAVSEVLGTDESPSVQSSTTKKFSMSQLGTYILNSFSGLSLGGITQTVKAAIDAISNLLGNSTMGTTATTVTGAIAEHEGDITALNSNFPFVAKYITKSITIQTGTAASPSITEIDLSSEAPSGKSLYFAIVDIGVYCLPYIGPNAATYTTAYRISQNKLAIYNGGATWSGTQTVYILGFFR